MMYPLVHDTWGSEELSSIQAVIDSNRFSMGPFVENFENEFARRFGAKHAICVNSGSSANLIAVAAAAFHAGLKPGDEVIVPAVGWSTTYSPLYFLHLKPVFVDIDASTFNIDETEIEEKITERTKAILCVNLLGRPCDFQSLKNICAKHDLILLEDNCESMGAEDNGIQCGVQGLAGTFSFFFSHHITTIEGGMVTTNDPGLATMARSIRAHGWLRGIDTKYIDDSKLPPDNFREMFWFIAPGFNVRPTEFTGAIGLSQLSKFDEFLEIRKKNAAHFHSRIRELPPFSTQAVCDGHSYFSFPVVVTQAHVDEIDIHALRSDLIDKGVEIRPIASGDITGHPMMDYFKDVEKDQYPVASHIDRFGFMFGNHPVDIRKNIDYAIEIIANHV